MNVVIIAVGHSMHKQHLVTASEKPAGFPHRSRKRLLAECVTSCDSSPAGMNTKDAGMPCRQAVTAYELLTYVPDDKGSQAR